MSQKQAYRTKKKNVCFWERGRKEEEKKKGKKLKNKKKKSFQIRKSAESNGVSIYSVFDEVEYYLAKRGGGGGLTLDFFSRRRGVGSERGVDAFLDLLRSVHA
ncbi:hypothetical protein AVEN_45982-1 [Araneus ventricosus]|uniref:Uncharacterized protein n=1 Tax=Araneus ventricosus TaxID=182803 RepID=A0A4Y2IUC7_ARAVE|nr:hypothetical protein AVEN_45982-1 [Araneus ventricosus]